MKVVLLSRPEVEMRLRRHRPHLEHTLDPIGVGGAGADAERIVGAEHERRRWLAALEVES